MAMLAENNMLNTLTRDIEVNDRSSYNNQVLTESKGFALQSMVKLNVMSIL